MKRFYKILKKLLPYKVYLGLSILFNILMAIFTIIGIPLFIPFFELLFYKNNSIADETPATGIKANLIDQFQHYIADMDPQTALSYIIFLIIIVFLLKNIFRYLAMFFIAPVRNGFIRDLRKDVFDHLIVLPIQYYKNKKRGDILSRMSMDILEVENSILNILDTLIKSPLIILGSLSFMFYISVELTSLVLMLIPFTIIFIGGLSRKLKKQSAGAQSKLGELMAILEETLGGLKIIKSFNATQKLKNKFQSVNNEHRSILTKLLWRRDLGSPVAEVLGVGVISILMYSAAKLVFDDKLAPETFFAFIYAFYMIIEPAKSFSSAYYSYQKGDAALERLESIFEEENSIVESPKAIEKKDFISNIKFDNISFIYPDASEYTLKNISFTIKRGEKVALIGDSGAGKTTIVDLLPRFIDTTKGAILIDDIDIRDVQIMDLRNLIGMVTQDSILFNDTIANNISFGIEEADIKRIKHTAEIANISEFVDSLPLAYDTMIGDQGSKLSGGQKQRIAIARAVIKNAQILILDEATSSLDSVSEKRVQVALNNMLKDKTALIIAHRLSTIREADKIVVLKDGQIVEQGNHQDLMENKKEYYKFVQLQSLNKD